MTYQIEKNIPVPGVASADPGALAATMRKLEVGDSFVLQKDSNSQRSYLYVSAKRIGIKIKIRQIAEGVGIRVWRVEGGAA